MTTPYMACGHAAQATRGDGRPLCAICVLMDPRAEIVAEPPDLTGREMRCDCGKRKPSTLEAAFFAYRQDEATDEFYCGCAGWE